MRDVYNRQLYTTVTFLTDKPFLSAESFLDVYIYTYRSSDKKYINQVVILRFIRYCSGHRIDLELISKCNNPVQSRPVVLTDSVTSVTHFSEQLFPTLKCLIDHFNRIIMEIKLSTFEINPKTIPTSTWNYVCDCFDMAVFIISLRRVKNVDISDIRGYIYNFP